MKRTLLLPVSVVVLLVACGGDDESSATTAPTAPTAASASTVAPAADGCDLLVAYRDVAEPFGSLMNSTAPDPATVEASFQDMIGALDALAAGGPAEITGDAAIVADLMSQLDAVFSKSGYDFEAVISSADQATVDALLDDQATTDAQARIVAYAETNCA